MLVVAGGVIPAADIPGLKAAGIAEVFTPGTPTKAAVDFIRQRVQPAERQETRWHGARRYPPAWRPEQRCDRPGAECTGLAEEKVPRLAQTGRTGPADMTTRC